MSEWMIREAKTGEASLVSCFYFRLFEKQFNFLPNVEQYFLHAAAELFDCPEGNCLWLVEMEDKIVGSICVVKRGMNEAQLRLFGIDECMQGKHVGDALLKTAMDFCCESYTKISLWTIDICRVARHLYSKYGFQLVDTKLNTTWADYSMMEELWEYDQNKKIELIPGEKDLPHMAELIKEYTDDIISTGKEEVKACLSSQHLDEELLDLERKYSGPNNRMYIAKINGEIAGSVCVTENDKDYCEIKRLYVRPAFRGSGLGGVLLEKAIVEARDIGYHYMRLDTFPFMESAIRMYEKRGFYSIEKYNDNPAPNAIFLQLDLGY